MRAQWFALHAWLPRLMSDRKDAVVRQMTCMQIWATGDPSTADAIMAEDVRHVDLLFAHETSSRAEFKSMIHSVFKVSINAVLPCILTVVWSQFLCTQKISTDMSIWIFDRNIPKLAIFDLKTFLPYQLRNCDQTHV